jgi:transcriptional regulator with AAA-type ATPase domain/polyferredoxin
LLIEVILNNKKIGGYLIENNVCDETTLVAALDLQSSLSKEGVYQPLGKIILEKTELNPEVLESCLQQQRIDILSNNSMFKGLSQPSLRKIAEVALNYVMPQNTIVVKEHDPGDSYFIIISGKVQIFKSSEEGDETILTALNSGDGFGEMALLTGAPRSASVKTLVPTSFLVIPKNSFDQVIAENPDLSKIFLKILSERLALSGVQLAKTSATERAYQQFISQQRAEPEMELVGESKLIRRMREKIASLPADDPVLVAGEAGTEKKIVAGIIHRNSRGAEKPFLMFDAKNVNLVSSDTGGAKPDQLQLELAQESALFGHERGSFSFAKTRRLGFIEVCNTGTLVIENVDQLVESIQLKLAHFLRKGCFTPLGRCEMCESSVRIVTTSSADLSQLVSAGKFNEELYNLLAPQTLTVPPLKKRKKDIRLIVKSRIEHYNKLFGKAVKDIDPEAYNKLMAYDWPGNTDELDVVVRRAVNLSSSDTLMPEHFFIGLVQIEGKLTFNLLKLEQVSKVLQSKLFPVLPQLVTGFFFVFLFFFGFFGNQLPESNVTVILTWGIWWPFLVLSWFLAARIWCALCPMGALNDLLSKFCSKKLSVPRFIRNYGLYLGALGMLTIFFAESVSSMPFSPRGTAILLLCITLFAATSGLLYSRRVWCRYLCPLGKLAGIMSRCSVVELRSNLNVCNTNCTTHGCYVGEKHLAGCPMYEGPFSMKSNQDCILCGNCVKICPDKAPKFNLRLPGHELWTFLKPDKAVIVLLPLILGTQLFRGMETTPLFHQLEQLSNSHVLSLGLLLIGMILISYLFIKTTSPTVFSKLSDPEIKKTDLFVYSLLPLCFTFELSYHVEPLLKRAGLFIPVLGRQLGFNWDILGIHAASGSVTLLQILIVLVGLIASRVVLKNIRERYEEKHPTRTQLNRSWPLLFIAFVYSYFFIVG